jgi:hypothetical protein
MAVHGRPVFARLSERLQRVDRAVFTAVPPLRRWSWMAVFKLAGPLKSAPEDL